MPSRTVNTCALCLQRLDRNRDDREAQAIGVCRPCYNGSSETARKLHVVFAVRRIRKARTDNA